MRSIHFLILFAVACLPMAVRAQTSDKPETRSDPNVALDSQRREEDLKEADAKRDDAKSDDADDRDEKDADAKDDRDGKRIPKIRENDTARIANSPNPIDPVTAS